MAITILNALHLRKKEEIDISLPVTSQQPPGGASDPKQAEKE